MKKFYSHTLVAHLPSSFLFLHTILYTARRSFSNFLTPPSVAPFFITKRNRAPILDVEFAGWIYIAKKDEEGDDMERRVGNDRTHPHGIKSLMEASLAARTMNMLSSKTAVLAVAKLMATFTKMMLATATSTTKTTVMTLTLLYRRYVAMTAIPTMTMPTEPQLTLAIARTSDDNGDDDDDDDDDE